MCSSISIDWGAINTLNSSERVPILWDAHNHSVSNVLEGQYTLSVKVSRVAGYIWWITGVYGPEFWEVLKVVQALCGSH